MKFCESSPLKIQPDPISVVKFACKKTINIKIHYCYVMSSDGNKHFLISIAYNISKYTDKYIYMSS